MDLVNYIQNQLRTPSKSVAVRTGGGLPKVPSQALTIQQPNIIDGEWSEVPKELTGPKGALTEAAKPAAAAGTGLGSSIMGNPLIAAIMGSIQGDVMNNYKPPWERAPYPAAEDPMTAGNGPPPPASGPPISGPQDNSAPPQMPWWASGDMTKMLPGASPSVPMPRPRPAQASAPMDIRPPIQQQQQAAPPPQQTPDTSFFMRNALMMHDPVTGQLIDPQGAASVSGPDLITKMMGYLNSK